VSTIHTTTGEASTKAGADQPLLSVEGLRVTFYTETGEVHAVQDVTFHVREGETLAIVGESGSGKSITAMAVMGLLPLTAEQEAGVVRFRGAALDQRQVRRLRGTKMTMIFQDPMASLNPLLTVGAQITEVLRKRCGYSRSAAQTRAAELFDIVGIPEPRRRLKQYPFEFSGGMAQRVMIAIALAPEPDLIIADEPTTALDVTIQAQILDLIARLQEETGVAMILITHDLGVVAGVADRVTVMYGGRVVEEADAEELFGRPEHPYTLGLLASTPHPYQVRQRLIPIQGSPPATARVVPGCAFDVRCPRASDRCVEERPPLDVVGQPPPDGATPTAVPHRAACWHPCGSEDR
jgi:oligopeptide/dipeptide ABC transporter ATP-binding protein